MKMGARMTSSAKIWILGALIGSALWLNGCAGQSGQQPVAEMPTAANTTPDGGLVTPAPSKKGLIVPGAPSSGTAGVAAARAASTRPREPAVAESSRVAPATGSELGGKPPPGNPFDEETSP
jgi:hypothetical protein